MGKRSTAVEVIFKETVFTMEVEGFILTSDEKQTLLDVLSGKVTYETQLQKYLENAKRRGKA